MKHFTHFISSLISQIKNLIPGQKVESIGPKHLVASVKSDDKFAALAEVLQITHFFKDVTEKVHNSGKKKSDFLIVIKPNFMVFHSSRDQSAHTDPELVEYLIDRLWDNGFQRIKVVESQNVLGKWYENRDVKTVARAAGYTGKNYEIVDLTLEAIPYHFGGEFGEDFVGQTWLEADYRISFAKNKTHPANRFTLALKNIFGVTTSEDKYLEYHKKKEWDSAVIEMYRAFPVHFGFIDAFVSADQAFGFRGDKTAKETKTILGSKNILALDWVGAMKMALDPIESRLMKKAVAEWGKPRVELYGNSEVYEDWDNTPLLLDKLDDVLEECYLMHNFFTHAIMFKPDEIFVEKEQGFFSHTRRLLGLD